ncbi:MAG TPA: gluconeogenesis factor YvcK family protein [Chloroflexia bacterium]|nr:gluconeogenesis factor YvcK family protein [Chloroflexia bacterium]
MERWFPSGYGFRRWAIVLALGVALIGLGLAMGVTNLYRQYIVDQTGTTFLYYATLQFIPHPWREALVALIGLGLLTAGGWGITRAVQKAAARGRPMSNPVLAPMRAARRAEGPRIVAIGGGTGMPTLLRGLKLVTDNISAVVNVVDDGGSSGRLRRDLGILPPGDFRNNLVALSEVEPLMAELFQFRFEGAGDLEGHSFGNLFLVAMSQVTGSFEHAIRESSRVLAVRGKVLPSSLENIELYAELQNGEIVRGESVIPRTPVPLKRVFMQPPHAPGYPEAMSEIYAADIIVLGPGSLFTSIMPPLLVEDIARAVKANPTAVKVYVCNVATQPGETDGFGAVEHVRALHNHIGPGLFDYVIYNSNYSGERDIKPEWKVSMVRLDQQAAARFSRIEFVPADVVRDDNPLRHDPQKLADAVMRLYENRGGGGAPGRVRQRERRFDWQEAEVEGAEAPEVEHETTKVS